MSSIHAKKERMERKEGGGKRKRKTQEQERKKLPETYYSSNVAITLPVMLLDYQNLYLTNDSRECSSRHTAFIFNKLSISQVSCHPYGKKKLPRIFFLYYKCTCAVNQDN